MLWRTTCICCGEQTCSPQYILLMLSTTYHPQHIILMLSTTYHPQHIQRVFSTTYTPCSPQYITCAPQYIILAQKCSPRYSKNTVLYVVGVSIPEHVVENTLYIVGVCCCGVHPYVVECISCGVLHYMLHHNGRSILPTICFLPTIFGVASND